jgi:indole-3-glycerol phosphate synthase
VPRVAVSEVGEDFLAGMAARSWERASAARARVPEAQMRSEIARLSAAPMLQLSPARFDLIAELKLRSPAAGALARSGAGDAAEVAARVREYAAAEAVAVSVLTEPSRFDGDLAHLRVAADALAAPAAAARSPVPAMRKDFLVDPYQVLEARAAGAGGVLVILRMLPRGDNERLIDEALRQGLFVLIETFDEAEIDVAAQIVQARGAWRGAPAAMRPRMLIGVNCRELVTLQVVPGRLEALASRLPSFAPRVAESGVATAADAARVAAAGYDLALVGSALMTGAAPRAIAASMLAAARAAVSARS